MFKKKNKKEEPKEVVEIEFKKTYKFDVSDEDIQTTFNIDSLIYKDAENIEEVEVDENENNETE